MSDKKRLEKGAGRGVVLRLMKLMTPYLPAIGLCVLCVLLVNAAELVKPYEAERTIKQSRNLYLTVYNMEVVLLLAFRLNSYQARAIRKELMGRIERDHKPFEVILTASRGTGGLM